MLVQRKHQNAMDTREPLPELPEEVREERIGRKRMWRYLLIGLVAVVVLIFFGGAMRPNTEQVPPVLSDTLR